MTPFAETKGKEAEKKCGKVKYFFYFYVVFFTFLDAFKNYAIQTMYHDVHVVIALHIVVNWESIRGVIYVGALWKIVMKNSLLNFCRVLSLT